MMKEFWDQRYSQEAYAYGETPNVYFKDTITNLRPGKILMPAEGEGRNAVYAATLGWDVDAFDLSTEGKRKSEALAARHKVKINYLVGDCSELLYPENTFDALGLIYAHFNTSLKSKYHRQLVEYLKPDGRIIFEAFSKRHADYQHINPTAGGPRDVDMLFSIDEVKRDFPEIEFIYLCEEEINLQEGEYHSGKGMVIRFFGKKKQPS
jgi:SAM-dependent methyltransferase